MCGQQRRPRGTRASERCVRGASNAPFRHSPTCRIASDKRVCCERSRQSAGNGAHDSALMLMPHFLCPLLPGRQVAQSFIIIRSSWPSSLHSIAACGPLTSSLPDCDLGRARAAPPPRGQDAGRGRPGRHPAPAGRGEGGPADRRQRTARWAALTIPAPRVAVVYRGCSCTPAECETEGLPQRVHKHPAESRSGMPAAKTDRLKQAKAEAEKEIKAYKQQREEAYQKRIADVRLGPHTDSRPCLLNRS